MSSNNYDSFERWQRLEVEPFTFQASRFEVWQNGEATASGPTQCVVEASEKPVEAGIGAKIELKNVSPTTDGHLLDEISRSNVFDVFITSSDRLQLVKVPSSGEGQDNMGLSMMKTTIGNTRDHFDFSRKDPFCTNIFTRNKKIMKITFSFSNPEKLVELYSPEDDSTNDSDSATSALKREAERISNLRKD